jgi:C-terminal processing protease CtpA/Prc
MKRNNEKTLYLIIFLVCLQFTGIAQKEKSIMYSNSLSIKIYHDERIRDWSISPNIRPDILEIYDITAKKKIVKFVSDVDSITFEIKLNKPVYFSIIYKGDTAYTGIRLTNSLPNTISKADKIMALSLFWSETRYNFAFFDQLTFDWDSLYKVYIPMVEATTNDVDFYEIMGNFAGSLQDGHSGVYNYNIAPYVDYIPMNIEYFNDSLYIVRTRGDLESIYPIGSKILEINGLPFKEYMDTYINPFVQSKYKPTQQNLAAARLLSSRKLEDKITIKYITPNQEIRINTPPRDGEKNRAKYPNIGKKEKTEFDPVRIKWLGNNIAVLELNTFWHFDGKLIPYFEKIKDTLYTADGIIIDMRHNGGGVTDIAWYFLQYIIQDSFYINYAWQTRVHEAVKKANGNYMEKNKAYYEMNAYRTVLGDTMFIGDTIRKFSVPVVILISTMTASSAEDFLVDLYERKDRPLLIGQSSFGSTGSPLVFKEWPDSNGVAKVCTRRVLFPYSLKPLDKGIEPDIWVHYTFEEYMSDFDKEIDVAVHELKKMIAKEVKQQKDK